jgi:hypothetical protein
MKSSETTTENPLPGDTALFLDLEASGIHPDSYPIEIGIFGEAGLSFECLIKPADCWQHWSHDAQDLHQIAREQLMSEGTPVSLVARELNALFAHKILWAESNLDLHWMQVLFEAAGCEPLFEVRNLMNALPHDQWKAFYSHRSTKVAHRALADAKHLGQAWSAYLLNSDNK